MSNSNLVNYTRLSPNHSGHRTHEIDTITIHCMAGNLSVESCGALFASESRQASSNYGIGTDGRIGLYVDEDNRSWCTSSKANDQRAVTIEVANTAATAPWPVSEKAYESLIKLVADICQRNNIKRLVWKADKSLIGQVDKQNMTVHRWFANKACPGDYLYSRHGEIASRVNTILAAEKTPPEGNQAAQNTSGLYRVQMGAFSKIDNASSLLARVQGKGIDAIIKKVGNLYKVQTGAYSVKANAEAQLARVKAAGFPDAYISTENGGTVVATSPVKEQREYTVVKGDSLWLIAAKQLGDGNRWKEIYTLNGLTSQTIYAGMKLKIPD